MELINILKWTGIVYMIFMCVQAIISTFEIHRKMQDMMSQEYMKENNISLMDKHEKKEHVKHEVFLMSCRSDKYLFTSLAVIRFSNFIASKFI